MSNEFVSDFQIIGSSIRNVKIKNDFISIETNNRIKRKLDVSHEIKTIEVSNNGKAFSGIIILHIKVTISCEKKKYSIDLSIEGCFNAPVEMGEEQFKEMLQLNGLTTLYSIARGFVQSVSSQTLISGNILLPMFNVVAYNEEQKKKNEMDIQENN